MLSVDGTVLLSEQKNTLIVFNITQNHWLCVAIRDYIRSKNMNGNFLKTQPVRMRMAIPFKFRRSHQTDWKNKHSFSHV